ncbi:MAG: hypothetical protein CME62_08135 [Halobacteriovoraceae bacterium]|nr:hypothetical protein [Halobacteriovoraceae bacterium]
MGRFFSLILVMVMTMPGPVFSQEQLAPVTVVSPVMSVMDFSKASVLSTRPLVLDLSFLNQDSIADSFNNSICCDNNQCQTTVMLGASCNVLDTTVFADEPGVSEIANVLSQTTLRNNIRFGNIPLFGSSDNFENIKYQFTPSYCQNCVNSLIEAENNGEVDINGLKSEILSSIHGVGEDEEKGHEEHEGVHKAQQYLANIGIFRDHLLSYFNGLSIEAKMDILTSKGVSPEEAEAAVIYGQGNILTHSTFFCRIDEDRYNNYRNGWCDENKYQENLRALYTESAPVEHASATSALVSAGLSGFVEGTAYGSLGIDQVFQNYSGMTRNPVESQLEHSRGGVVTGPSSDVHTNPLNNRNDWKNANNTFAKVISQSIRAHHNQVLELCEKDSFQRSNRKLVLLQKVLADGNLRNSNRISPDLENLKNAFQNSVLLAPHVYANLQDPSFLCEMVKNNESNINIFNIDEENAHSEFSNVVQRARESYQQSNRVAELFNNIEKNLCFNGNQENFERALNLSLCGSQVASVVELEEYKKNLRPKPAGVDLAIASLKCESLAYDPEQLLGDLEQQASENAEAQSLVNQGNFSPEALAAARERGRRSSLGRGESSRSSGNNGRNTQRNLLATRDENRDASNLNTFSENRAVDARRSDTESARSGAITRMPAGGVEAATAATTTTAAGGGPDSITARLDNRSASNNPMTRSSDNFFNEVTTADISRARENEQIAERLAAAEARAREVSSGEEGNARNVAADIASRNRNVFGERQNLSEDEQSYQNMIEELREEIRRENVDQDIASEENPEVQRLLRENENLRRERFDMQRQLDRISGRIDTIARGNPGTFGASGGAASSGGAAPIPSSSGGMSTGGEGRAPASEGSGTVGFGRDITNSAAAGSVPGQSRFQLSSLNNDGSLALRVRDNSGELKEYNLTADNIFLEDGALRSIRIGNQEILASELSDEVRRQAIIIKLSENKTEIGTAADELISVAGIPRANEVSDPVGNAVSYAMWLRDVNSNFDGVADGE